MRRDRKKIIYKIINEKKEGKSMLLNYSVKGFKVFYDEVSFSMLANNYIKKNRDNTISKLGKAEDISVVKSAFIFGPNNTGKSCFIDSLKFFVNLIINEKIYIDKYTKNLFYDKDDPIEFKLEYLVGVNKYYYSIKINTNGILDEILELNDEVILNRSNPSEEIKEIINLIGDIKNKLYVFLLPKKYNFISEDLKKFVSSFEFVDFNAPLNIDEILKETNFEKISEMISKCDLQIDTIIDNSEDVEEFIKSKAKDDKNKDTMRELLNNYKLISSFKFKGKRVYVPLVDINSKGTDKVVKMSYILLNAISGNKVLVIDEFENSLHTIMSKALISFFNSNNNTRSQLIATTHDLLLLDDEFLLRKDQIWFIFKDENNNYLYSLDDFKDNKEIDSRGNMMIKYMKGLFGALPKPTLFKDDVGEEE